MLLDHCLLGSQGVGGGKGRDGGAVEMEGHILISHGSPALSWAWLAWLNVVG